MQHEINKKTNLELNISQITQNFTNLFEIQRQYQIRSFTNKSGC